MKSDKESDHRFCCRKHLVYILLLSYLFNDIQNVRKNITSAAFLEKQSLEGKNQRGDGAFHGQIQ